MWCHGVSLQDTTKGLIGSFESLLSTLAAPKVRKTRKNVIFCENRHIFQFWKYKNFLESSKNCKMSWYKHIALIYGKKVTYAVKKIFSITVAADFWHMPPYGRLIWGGLYFFEKFFFKGFILPWHRGVELWKKTHIRHRLFGICNSRRSLLNRKKK